jgi:hypothetical protein
MSRLNEKTLLLSRKDITSPNTSYVDESSAVSVVNGLDDDTVVRAIRTLTSTLQSIISLWSITFATVMIMSISPNYSTKIEAVSFICIISASFIGIVVVIQVWFRLCGNLKLIPKERVDYIRNQGYRLSAVMGDFMEYDSLPLLRRVLFSSFVLGVFLFLIAISTLLILLWISYGMIGMWHALIPVIVMFVMILFYMYSVNSFSALTCVNCSFVFMSMVSVARCS